MKSESIQHSRATWIFLTDGQIIIITLGHHVITDTSPMQVYVLDVQATAKDDIRASLQQSTLYANQASIHRMKVDSLEWFHTE